MANVRQLCRRVYFCELPLARCIEERMLSPRGRVVKLSAAHAARSRSARCPCSAGTALSTGWCRQLWHGPVTRVVIVAILDFGSPASVSLRSSALVNGCYSGEPMPRRAGAHSKKFWHMLCANLVYSGWCCKGASA